MVQTVCDTLATMTSPDIRLKLVSDWTEAQEFIDWMEQPRPWIAVDTETGGLDWWRNDLRLVQVGDDQTGWSIPWQGWGGLAKQAIEGTNSSIAMHNSKFDLHFLEHNGVKVPRHKVHDTMSMVGLLEPELSKGLKPASERHAFPGARQGARALQSIMDKHGWGWDTIPIDVPEYWTYAALDVVLTTHLAKNLYPKIHGTPLQMAYQYEVAVAQVLCDMERRGLLLDNEYIEKMVVNLEMEESNLRDWFESELSVRNPLSDSQLIKMFERFGYVFTETTDKGNKKLDTEVLDGIALDRPDLAEVVKSVHRVRNFHKIRGTYFESFLDLQDDNSRIHTSINPMGARTGRMSSSRPNLQNVPARMQGSMVRTAFVAANGHKLISADFDQIEYRIMVARAGEKRLINAIRDGQDLHTYMTSVVYGKPLEDVTSRERSIMKNATFAFLYGAGDAKFARMAGIKIHEAKAFRELYAEQFPAIAKYAHDVITEGRNTGRIETNYIGRLQVVDDPNEAYKLLNYVTQGEAGDVLKKKLVELSQTEVGPHMRLPIHDEILFEVPEEEVDQAVEIIQTVMPENDYYEVPLSVGADVLTTWGEKY